VPSGTGRCFDRGTAPVRRCDATAGTRFVDNYARALTHDLHLRKALPAPACLAKRAAASRGMRLPQQFLRMPCGRGRPAVHRCAPAGQASGREAWTFRWQPLAATGSDSVARLTACVASPQQPVRADTEAAGLRRAELLLQLLSGSPQQRCSPWPPLWCALPAQWERCHRTRPITQLSSPQGMQRCPVARFLSSRRVRGAAPTRASKRPARA